MIPTVTDALRALPDDLREPRPGPEPLAATTQGSPPTSAWYRSWLIGSTTARIALGYAAFGLKSVLQRDAGGDARRAADEDAAIRLLARMGYLRGAAMKVGQVLAQMPELTSAEVATTLGALCFEAPPMHAALVQEQLHGALNRSPEDAFATFDPRAFAAASLGQVHRATTHEGRDVAVKVQYPGIGRAVRADLRTLRTLILSMRFSRQYANIREQVDVIADMLACETDYRREARMQMRARELFHDEDGIVVPAVHEDLSAERVLTSDLLHGDHLEAFLARQPGADERRLAAERIWCGLLRLYYGGRLTYNDPNPGNVVFLYDGRIGLLDFGCTMIYDDADWKVVCDLDDAMRLPGDELDELLAFHLGLDMSHARDRECADLMRDIVGWMMEPMLADGLFNFGAGGYMDRGLQIVKTVMRKRQMRQCPLSIWSNRLLIGVRALLARLDVAIDARGIFEQEWPRGCP